MYNKEVLVDDDGDMATEDEIAEIAELASDQLKKENKLNRYMQMTIGDILKQHNWEDKKTILANLLEHEIEDAILIAKNDKMHKSNKKEMPSPFRESLEKSFAEFLTEQNKLEKIVNPELFAIMKSDNTENSSNTKKRPYVQMLLFTSKKYNWSFLYKIFSGSNCLKLFPFLVVMLLCNTNDNLFRSVRSAVKMNKTSVIDKRYSDMPIKIVDFLIKPLLKMNKKCIIKNTNNAALLLQTKFVSLLKLDICKEYQVDYGLCLAWLFDIFPELEYYTDYDELNIIKEMVVNSLNDNPTYNESIKGNLCAIYNISEDVNLTDYGQNPLVELENADCISEGKLLEVYNKYSLMKCSNFWCWKYMYINIVSACRSAEQDASLWIPKVFASLGLKARARSIAMKNDNILFTMNNGSSYALKDFEFISFDRESLLAHYRSVFGLLLYGGDLEINGTIKINQATVRFSNDSICRLSSEDFKLNHASIHQFEFIRENGYSVRDTDLLPFLSWAILCGDDPNKMSCSKPRFSLSI